MASKNVVELTDQNFEQEVIQSQTPVLADFWAEWCMPCKMLAPVIDELAGEYAGRLKVCKADVEAARQTAIRFGVEVIPTVILFKGGQPAGIFRGVQNKRDYKAAIDKLL
jgi:thioredoxin 1